MQDSQSLYGVHKKSGSIPWLKCNIDPKWGVAGWNLKNLSTFDEKLNSFKPDKQCKTIKHGKALWLWNGNVARRTFQKMLKRGYSHFSHAGARCKLQMIVCALMFGGSSRWDNDDCEDVRVHPSSDSAEKRSLFISGGSGGQFVATAPPKYIRRPVKMAPLWYKCPLFGVYSSRNRYFKKSTSLNNALHCVELQDLSYGFWPRLID